jgi:hypothetical protein
MDLFAGAALGILAVAAAFALFRRRKGGGSEKPKP